MQRWQRSAGMTVDFTTLLVAAILLLAPAALAQGEPPGTHELVVGTTAAPPARS
jgi:hypothetical protein